MGSNFVHLHVHSEYSFSDGACRIKDIVQKAISLGQKAVAITDHSAMYGVPGFYTEAVANGIKPIIGCEICVAEKNDTVYSYNKSPYHLVLLCQNNMGYHNLMKLITESYQGDVGDSPLVNTDVLRKYHDGLICLSSGIKGELADCLIKGLYNKAYDVIEKYIDIFGKENYYIEIQDNNLPLQKDILPLLCSLSAEKGIPLVATNNVHYINKDDADTQRVLMKIHKSSENEYFVTDEFYMKSQEEMTKLFHFSPSAVSNTVEIANRCNVQIEAEGLKLPEYICDNGEDKNLFFKNLCRSGLKERYGENCDKSIEDRMDYEINIIENMGYVDYYLIVWDFIRYAKSHDIPVGPGRGSGAGSLCAYCIGITETDPIKYHLIFERFLNPQRISMPDFDVDFCVDRRQEVIDYVVNRYGKDKTAQIITFNTMAARSSIRDAGRAMDIEYSLCDRIAKMISAQTDATIKNELNKNDELSALYKSDNTVRNLLDMAMKIEGMPQNSSVHPAGLLVSNTIISDVVPLQKNEDVIITQYELSAVEKSGLLKIDFLALRNLTIIKKCVELIRKSEIEISLNDIPLDDKNVYRMIATGRTLGVFQLESQGIRNVLTRFVPEKIEDIISVLALYRPGPMDSISRYIENKNHPENISYKHPLLKEILYVTYGCIIYQEQVMEIFRKLAGYSYGRADVVRRAMSKKNHDEMENERKNFIYGNPQIEGCHGAVANGVPEEIANSIFDDMLRFASYAFNKSHAASYALVTYQTAYLKCNYYKQYMAALMSYTSGSQGKLNEYISECRSSGVKIIKPSVNERDYGFVITDTGIRFGISAIKNIGECMAKRICEERIKNGVYKSVHDFFRRNEKSGISKIIMKNLIYSGALDELGLNRRQMIENIETIMKKSASVKEMEGQFEFFEDDLQKPEPDIPWVEEYTEKELIYMEKEATGIYISGTPFSLIENFCSLLKVSTVSSLLSKEVCNSDVQIQVAGTIAAQKEHINKNKDKMCFFTLEDASDNIECVVFNDVYRLFKKKIQVGDIVYITGKLSYRDGKFNIMVQAIFDESEFIDMIKRKKVCINTTSEKIKQLLADMDDILADDGDMLVCFYLSDVGKVISPRSKNKIAFSDSLPDIIRTKTGGDDIALIN